MNAAHLEAHLKFIIANLLNREHPGLGLIMTRKLSAVPMLELITPLLKYWVGHSESLARADNVMIRVRKHLKERNDLIHSIWITDKEDNVVKPFSMFLDDEGVDFKPIPLKDITPERLFKLADDIDIDVPS